jgi:hypothetical protein
LLLLFAGTETWMHFYVKRTKPILQTELTAAELARPGMLAKVGSPPGATVIEHTAKSYVNGGRQGQWKYTRVGVSWGHGNSMLPARRRS